MKCRVMGNTLNKALGLKTLNEQKEHHYVHIKGQTPAPISKELAEHFKHGQKNGKNAVATIVSIILPSLYPLCKSFLDVGPVFVYEKVRG